MKKTICALFTLCLVINNIYARKNNIDINIPFDGKGTLVKMVIENDSGLVASSTVREYDENANLIRLNSSYIDYDDTYEYRFSYFNYNENGNIIKEYTIRPNIGDTIHKTCYKYNEQDKIIEQYYVDRYNRYGQKYVYTYDSLMRISNTYTYDSIRNIKVSETLIFIKEDYHYYDNGYTVESFAWDEMISTDDSAYIKKVFEKQRLNDPTTSKYDDNGKILSRYFPSGRSYLYTYNEEGYLIKFEEYSDSITQPSVSEYIYTPIDDSIIIKDIYYKNNLSSSIKYFKKNKAVIESTFYDERGKRDSYWTNSYNERGDLNQSLDYEKNDLFKKTTYTYKYGANAKAINMIDPIP